MRSNRPFTCETAEILVRVDSRWTIGGRRSEPVVDGGDRSEQRGASELDGRDADQHGTDEHQQAGKPEVLR